jgi:hypothetical protein
LVSGAFCFSKFALKFRSWKRGGSGEK